MVDENDRTIGPSRRRLLTTLGVTSSAAIAGCMDVLSDDPGEDDGNGNGNGDGNGGTPTNDGSVRWPAIQEGELLSDFETLDGEWFPRTGEMSAAPDEARIGSQAAVIENDGRTARMDTRFPDGLDLEGWGVSLAVKPESATDIVVEFIAPDRDHRLQTTRRVPAGYDGWFRLDCAYEQKPGDDEPDLSNVTRINIIARNPDEGPTRLVVDDLRRTEIVGAGKAILAFYGGHSSHYDIAADMLEERGWSGTAAVDPTSFGNGNRMSVDQLQDLQNRGWEICAYPRGAGALAGRSESNLRTVLEPAKAGLENHGFEDGARHLFVPNWRRMDETVTRVARDVFDSAFVFGSCPTWAPPTGPHTMPVIWGPALHNGVRRHINLADQYGVLTVIRIPPIVEDDEDEDSQMSLADFEHLLNHLEHRGVDVITPSEAVDGALSMDEDSAGGEGQNLERPSGTILEAGRSHEFSGSGSDETSSFDLDSGVVTADFSHNGSSEFVVELSGTNDVLTHAAGNASGESIMAVDSGSYQLGVDADGPWSIDLDQPQIHSDDLQDLPVSASGTGSAYIGPIWTESDTSLSITHDGNGQFIVTGYGADGSREVIVNQTGTFDGGRSYNSGGTVWLNIEADGDWTVEAEES